MTHPDTEQAPEPDLRALAPLASQLAKTFVSVAADIALVIDGDGVIKHVAQGGQPIAGSAGQWLGRAWVDTVTGSTRRKIELLLSEAQTNGVTRRREVNHPSADTDDIPVAYSAIRLGPDGPVVAVGRDLRAVAAIQQRFVEASQAMERDYWTQRQAESQVRTLYQMATDAVLVVDAQTMQVVQANEAAQALLWPHLSGSLVGTDAMACVLPAERPGFMELLVTARNHGRPGVMRLHAAPALVGPAAVQPVFVEVSATPLRADPAMLLMVQMRATDSRPDEAESSRMRSAWVDGLADALVVTDSSGKVLMANPAFMLLCGAADPAAVTRRSLTDLMGDRAHTLAKVLQKARREGLAHADPVFAEHSHQEPALQQHAQAMALRRPAPPASGPTAPTGAWAVSAVLLHVGDQECMGVRLRKLHAVESLSSSAGPVERLAHAIGQLGNEMGLLPLTDLLQQATTLAERHLVSQALLRSAGRLVEAGHLLGIPVTELQLRMQHLGLTGKEPELGGPSRDEPPRQ